MSGGESLKVSLWLQVALLLELRFKEEAPVDTQPLCFPSQAFPCSSAHCSPAPDPALLYGCTLCSLSLGSGLLGMPGAGGTGGGAGEEGLGPETLEGLPWGGLFQRIALQPHPPGCESGGGWARVKRRRRNRVKVRPKTGGRKDARPQPRPRELRRPGYGAALS